MANTNLPERLNNTEFRELMVFLKMEELFLTKIKKGNTWSHMISINYSNKRIKIITCNVCDVGVSCYEFKKHLKTVDHHEALLKVDQFFHPVYTYAESSEKAAKGEKLSPAELQEALVKATQALTETNIIRFVLAKSIAERIINVEAAVYKELLSLALSRNIEHVNNMLVRVNLPLEELPKLEFKAGGNGPWKQMLTTEKLHQNSIYFCQLCSKVCDGITGVNQHVNNYAHKNLQLVTPIRVIGHREVTKNCTFHFGSAYSLKIKTEGIRSLEDIYKASKKAISTNNKAGGDEDVDNDEVIKKDEDINKNESKQEENKKVAFVPFQPKLSADIFAKVKLLKGKTPKLPDVRNYSDLDNHGLIGVEYVVKLTKFANDPKPVYECALCEYSNNELEMQNHLIGYRHRQRYLEKHYPKCIENLNNTIGIDVHDQMDMGKILSPIFAKIALAIEKHHSRCLPFLVSAQQFESKRQEMIAKLLSFQHADEKNGPDFTKVLTPKEILEFVDIKDGYRNPKFDNTSPATFTTVPKGKVYLGKREHSQRLTIDPIVKTNQSNQSVSNKQSQPQRPSKPQQQQSQNLKQDNQRQPQAKPQAQPQNVKQSVVNQRQTKPQAQSQNGKQFAENQRQSKPQQQQSQNIKQENQRQNRPQTQPQNAKQAPENRRQFTPQSQTQNVKQYSENQQRSYPQSQNQNSDNQRKRPTTEKSNGNDIWSKYRAGVGEATTKLNSMYNEYKMNPESHPLFKREWFNFWSNRKQELQRQGIDYRFHNCQSEFKDNFRNQLERFYGEELYGLKINVRKALNIPLDAIEGKPFGSAPNTAPFVQQPDNIEPVFKKQKFGNDRSAANTNLPSTWAPNAPADQKNYNLNRNQPPSSSINADKKPNIIHVLRLMTALEDYLGSFGSKVTNLLSMALTVERNCYNNPQQLEQNILTDGNCSLLETAMEKLKGVLYAGLVDEHKIQGFNKVIQNTEDLLKYALKIQPKNNEHAYSKHQENKIIEKSFNNQLPLSDTIEKLMAFRQSADAENSSKAFVGGYSNPTNNLYNEAGGNSFDFNRPISSYSGANDQFNRNNSYSNNNNNSNNNQRFDLNASNTTRQMSQTNFNTTTNKNNLPFGSSGNFNQGSFNGDDRNNFNNQNFDNINNFNTMRNANISSNNGRSAFGNGMEANMHKTSNVYQNPISANGNAGNWGRFRSSQLWSSNEQQQPQQQYQTNRGGGNF